MRYLVFLMSRTLWLGAVNVEAIRLTPVDADSAEEALAVAKMAYPAHARHLAVENTNAFRENR